MAPDTVIRTPIGSGGGSSTTEEEVTKFPDIPAGMTPRKITIYASDAQCWTIWHARGGQVRWTLMSIVFTRVLTGIPGTP